MLELKGISPAVQAKLDGLMEKERQLKAIFNIPDSYFKPLNDEEQLRLSSIIFMAQKDEIFLLFLDMTTEIFAQVATKVGPEGLKALSDGFVHTAEFILGKEGE